MIDLQDLKAKLTLEDVFDFLGFDYPLNERKNIPCVLPDHAERVGSLHLYPNDDPPHWQCFGCGEGGDVVDLVQRVKGWDFKDAADRLAEFAGEDAVSRSSRPRQKSLEQILQEVADLAHADVVAAIRRARAPLYSVEFRERVFEDYDEIVRQQAAGEIDATEAMKQLLAWRIHWKGELK